MQRTLLLLAAFCFIAVSASTRSGAAAEPRGAAAEPAVKDLSPTLAKIVGERKVPGLVAAVVQRGRIVAIGAAGLRQAGKPEPLTTADKLHLGSCGKAMTAFLCGQLVEEEKLRWDTPLTQMAPNLGKAMHADLRDITLEQLLRHRSGLPTDVAAETWTNLPADVKQARRAYLRSILALEPKARPGAKYIYSNTGYVAAGVMAENTTHQTWEELMTERVFGPLKMTSAGFGAPGTAERIDQPRGHRDDGTPVEPGRTGDNVPALGPAGTIHCSIEDWAKFVSQHLPTPMSPRLLKPQTMQRLQTAPPLKVDGVEEPRYAAGGWIVAEQPGQDMALMHSGSNRYWFSHAFLVPKRDIAVLIVCNAGLKDGAPAVQEALWRVQKEVADMAGQAFTP